MVRLFAAKAESASHYRGRHTVGEWLQRVAERRKGFAERAKWAELRRGGEGRAVPWGTGHASGAKKGAGKTTV